MTFSPEQKLAIGRAVAVNTMPYYSSALYSLLPNQNSSVPTIGVQKNWVMHYNPEFVSSCDSETLAFALLHEIHHLILEGFKRGKAMKLKHDDMMAWNIAQDASINSMLHDALSGLPEGDWILPAVIDAPDGLSFEEYLPYARKYLESKQQQNSQKEGGEGEKDGDGTKQIPGGGCKCGSAAGSPEDGEEAEGKGSDAGRSALDVERIKASIAGDVAEYIKANGAGSVPYGVRRWAESITKPSVVPWRQVLRHVLGGTLSYAPGLDSPTYKRPSRRQSSLGWGRNSARLHTYVKRRPSVLVAVDTSGSMDKDALDACLAETDAILRVHSTSVSFMSFDCEAHGIGKVKSVREAAKNLIGGGGTDFRAVFDQIEKEGTGYDAVIIMTDGCGPAPKTVPSKPSVVWCLIGSYKEIPYAGNEPVSYGTIVKCKDIKKAGRGDE